MEQAELQSKIAEYYQKLPEEVQVIFSGMTWLDTLREIGTKYSLNGTQLESITTETTLVLLGIVDINEYYETLRKEVQLEGTKSQELISEIDEKILKDISSSLYKTFNNNAIELERKNDADDYKKKLYGIGNKYKLPIDAIGEIENSTDRFLKGELTSMQYENSLSIITDFSPDRLSSLIKEINDEIIELRREELMEMKEEEEKTVEDIPLPPYDEDGKEKEIEIPLPPANYNEEKSAELSKKEEVSKPKAEENKSQDLINEILSGSKKTSENQIQNETDLYKEHGIEIISPEKNDKDEMNILAKKLTENTVSKTVVSDYSLPKINPKIVPINNVKGELPSNPHDAYHEEI